ncbi:uncharacterized protein (DUF924 family) [Kushneria sinocarnis]|uniref:Uncharacterized protein (DUF924 family) n=1 Tax=Kushneria sinocarnis TaxID=595502 RepID=A0A420X0E1_9GAMM|nr:DUF924 family protein [Kushneria sinocarnis]RKR07316.1 uncharacterized protein (DUF924 family) [Kushneria sinocarnis]
MSEAADSPTRVLDFWFKELRPRQWFRRDAQVDAAIRERFLALHARAAAGELWCWRASDEGRLAEIIVLDQFSRNLFRDDPRAWQQDPLALILAQEAIDRECDQRLALHHRPFVYMPLMHSESLTMQQHALRLFDQPGLERHLPDARHHCEVIRRFGRFPWRNAVLGRATRDDEQTFLTAPGER